MMLSVLTWTTTFVLESTISLTSSTQQKLHQLHYLFKVCNSIIIPDLQFSNLEPVDFLVHPVNIVNYTNGSAQLICLASSIPLPSIIWFKNNIPISESNRVAITVTNSTTPNERNTTSVLTITELQISDTADYHCVASNPGATGTGVTFTDTSDTASLLVQCELIISLHFIIFLSCIVRSSSGICWTQCHCSQ